MNFTNFTNSRAVALLEVLIAFVILAITAATAGSMIYTAVRTNSLSKNELVATNLAREGIEAIRNIIETNWLRCDTNKETSWLLKDSSSSCDDTGAKLVNDPYHRVSLNLSGEFKWTIDDYSSTSDPLDATIYKLNLATFGANQYYVHTGGTPSIFRRQIKIEYFDTDGNGTADNNGVKITSLVQWPDRSRMAKVELVSYVTNF